MDMLDDLTPYKTDGIINMLARLASYLHHTQLPSWLTRRNFTVYRNHRLKSCDVSVIISLYNYGRYLNTAVESVMRNLGPVVEIVIVNDASTDDSFSIAQQFLQSNHHITLIDKHRNTGLVDTRNIGLRHCVGNKVFILDADNWIFDDCLSAHLEMMNANPSLVACFGVIECFDESGGFVRHVSNKPFDFETLKHGNYIDAMAMFDRKKLISIGGYDRGIAKVGIGWEDYELWLRIGSLGLEVGFIDRPLSRYLVKPDSMLAQTDKFHVHTLIKYLNNKYDAYL